VIRVCKHSLVPSLRVRPHFQLLKRLEIELSRHHEPISGLEGSYGGLHLGGMDPIDGTGVKSELAQRIDIKLTRVS
jgi:hypothetical protein